MKTLKPERLFYKNGNHESNKARVVDDSDYPVHLMSNCVSLEDAKIIHEWLGRAIKYLEQSNDSTPQEA